MDEIELINLTKQANVIAAAGDVQGAMRLLKEVLLRQPDNEAALMHLASLIDVAEEKRGYLQRVLALNPYNEEAKAMLAELEEAPPEEKGAEAPEPNLEILYCHYHPHRETTLRCNKCGKPICTECAIRTPVGYRCPDCVRAQQDKFYTATASDIIKGALAAFGGGLLTGLVTLLSIMFLSGFLFFGFLVAFFLGPALGGGAAELSHRAMGRRRARNFPILGSVLLLAAILLILIPSGALFWGPMALGMAGLLIILALSTYYARLKF